jgi:AcrR family transcriptional regulator
MAIKCPHCGFSLQEKYHDIIETAFKLAQEKNYRDLSANEIADKAGVSRPLLNYYYGADCMAKIREELLILALEKEDAIILAQALLYKDINASSLSAELLEKISKAVTSTYAKT